MGKRKRQRKGGEQTETNENSRKTEKAEKPETKTAKTEQNIKIREGKQIGKNSKRKNIDKTHKNYLIDDDPHPMLNFAPKAQRKFFM